MLLNKFNSNNTSGIFLLVVLAPVMLVFGWSQNAAPQQIQGSPAYNLILTLVEPYPWLMAIVLFLFILLCAIGCAGLFNKLELFERRTQLPALIFVLFVCSSIHLQQLNPVLCGMPFILWALRRSWSALGEQVGVSPHFDAGVLIGIAAMFYAPYLLLLLALWVGMVFLRTFSWREWLFPAIGLGLVFLFVHSGSYLFGRPIPIPIPSFGQEWSATIGLGGTSWPTALFWILNGILFIWSLYWLFSSYGQSKMRRKNLFKAMAGLSFFLLLLLLNALFHSEAYGLAVLAIPAAFFFSFLFMGLYQKKRWLANSLFYVWLAVLLFSLWSERS